MAVSPVVRPATTAWGAVLGGWVATIGASVIFAHGMMTAFFSLFVLLVVLLLGALAESGIFAASGIRSLGDVIPGVQQLSVDSLGNALSFGAILGFLAAIFGGWLGGLLAPSQAVVATAAVVAPVRTAVPVSTSAPGRVVPAYGPKGGERVEPQRVDEVHTTRVERNTDPVQHD